MIVHCYKSFISEFFETILSFRTPTTKIDKEFYKLLRLFIKLASDIGGNPFAWVESSSRKIVVTKRSKMKFYWMSVLSWFSILWLLYPLIKAYVEKNAQVLGFTGCFLIAGLMDIGAAILLCVKGEEIASLFMTIIDFTECYQKKYLLPNLDNRRNWLEELRKFCLLLSIPALTNFVLIAEVHYIFFPKTPIYFMSLVPPHWTTLFPYLFICNFISYGLVVYALSCHFLLIINLLINFAITLHPIIHNELRLNRKSYRTKNTLRAPPTLALFYRSVEVLMKISNKTIQPVIIPMQSFVTYYAVFTNYTLVSEWNRMDRSMLLILLLGEIVTIAGCGFILQFGGWFSKNSTMLVKSWKHYTILPETRKYYRRLMRSCRPLGFRAEEEYGQILLKSLTVLKFFQGVIRGTFRALLTLRKK